jgi:enamine deaminase RidA (YjgF/YER057c/UK114 family)
MKKKFIFPDKLWDSSKSHFTQVVTIRGGKTIYISGQVAYDEEGTLVGKGDLREQAEQVCTNLTNALDAVDATPADVVKLTIFVKDYRPQHLEILNDTVYKLFPKKYCPASTLIGVQSLAREDLLIEVEAIAIVE